MRSHLVALALLLAHLPAALAAEPGQGQGDLQPAVSIAQRLTPAQVEAEASLLARLPGEHFAWELIHDKANVALFLDLAAGPRPARVVAAALHALGEASAPEPVPEDRLPVTPDYRTVVVARMLAPSRLVQHEAFEATAPLIGGKTADAATLAALTRILKTHKDPAVRHAAVRTLRHVSLSGLRSSPGLAEPVLTACADAEPVVRIQALALLQVMGTSSGFIKAAGQARVVKVLQAGMRHADLATRVVATTSLATVVLTVEEPERSAVLGQFVALLDDAQPALRAAGAMALLRSPQPRAMQRLLVLLDDTATTEVRVPGPAALDGEKLETTVTAVAGSLRTVGHAAVQALMMLAMAGSDAFYCEEPAGEKAEEMFKACVGKARAWAGRQAPLRK